MFHYTYLRALATHTHAHTFIPHASNSRCFQYTVLSMMSEGSTWHISYQQELCRHHRGVVLWCKPVHIIDTPSLSPSSSRIYTYLSHSYYFSSRAIIWNITQRFHIHIHIFSANQKTIIIVTFNIERAHAGVEWNARNDPIQSIVIQAFMDKFLREWNWKINCKKPRPDRKG